jgi:hypothetical protein
MYLLKFLQEARDRAIGVEVEYRLACSGEFYNRKVQTWDWRKSDVARILLDQPFSIFVTSRPFDSFPCPAGAGSLNVLVAGLPQG